MQLATCPSDAIAFAPEPELGAPVWTSSGDVSALMDQLQAATDALNMDITNWYNANKANAVAAGFANAWIKWRDGAYAAVKTARSCWLCLAWNHYDIAQAKLAQLLDWRNNYAATSGLPPSGPPPKVPESSMAGTIITGALVLAAVGGVAFVGWKVYTAVKVAGSVRALLPKAGATAGARRGRFARR
jgi:hypothetical protein